MLTRMHELKRVMIVGAGTMGSQIALQTALSGRYGVTLVDTVAGQLDKSRAQNQKLLDRSVEKGRLTKEKAEHALSRIKDSSDLVASTPEADLIIEAVIENIDAKKSVFEVLGKHAKIDAILASNSSTIAISRLADFAGRPERCCNMHFFHPVTVMQLCEVVRGPRTSDDTVQTAMEFVRSIDRTPVLINKEIWGFIVNRILFAASRGDALARGWLCKRRRHRHRGSERPELADGPLPPPRFQRPRRLLRCDAGPEPPWRRP